MPASGKTTFGKILAKEINYSFFDLDKLIVEQEKKSISNIFVENGENYFRKIESKILLNTTSYKNAVISTGGGAPCFYKNMGIINEYGKSIFINVKLENLVQRVLQGGNERPMFLNKNKEEIMAFMMEKFSEREKFYKQAHFTINGDNIILPEILSLLKA